jgi:hypothetical protein
MFIVVSLAATDSRRAKSKTGSSASKSKFRRISKAEFLKLSPNKQKSYLKTYPQSSHRHLLGGKRKAAKVDRVHKISRTTYDSMTRKEQRSYDKAHKGERKFRGKKHMLIKKHNPLLEKFRARRMNAPVQDNRLKRLSEAEARVADAQRSKYASELKAGINPEAMEACRNIKQGDLDKAADNLQSNKASVIAEFETKLERDRLDAVEISDEDREELRIKVDRGDDPDKEELEDIINEKKPTPRQKKVAEEALGHKSRNFFQRDMDTLGAIIRGEKVDNRGKSNFMTAMSILGRYALVAGGVSLIAIGAAPLAIHIVKEIYDGWKSLSAEEKEEFDIGHAYDAIVDHLRHTDLDALEGLSRKTKFVSTSSASRISYRCSQDERMLPFVDRTVHRVMLGGKQIGEIRATAPALAAPNVRIWQAYVTEGFDPIDFPHMDDPDAIKEPYVLTNDDANIEHNLELHCPLLMTLQEARNWVCQIVEK